MAFAKGYAAASSRDSVFMASPYHGWRSTCCPDSAQIPHRCRCRAQGFSLPCRVGVFAPWGQRSRIDQSVAACQAPPRAGHLGHSRPVPERTCSPGKVEAHQLGTRCPPRRAALHLPIGTRQPAGHVLVAWSQLLARAGNPPPPPLSIASPRGLSVRGQSMHGHGPSNSS